MTPSVYDLAEKIEHTLLKPEATPFQIDRLCDEAVEHGFYGVCVNPIYISRVRARFDRHSRSQLAAISVVGFPLGANATSTKVAEAQRALDDGASELDMVACVGLLSAGEMSNVRRDIEAVARVIHSRNSPGILKVIVESANLSQSFL